MSFNHYLKSPFQWFYSLPKQLLNQLSFHSYLDLLNLKIKSDLQISWNAQNVNINKTCDSEQILPSTFLSPPPKHTQSNHILIIILDFS